MSKKQASETKQHDGVSRRQFMAGAAAGAGIAAAAMSGGKAAAAVERPIRPPAEFDLISVTEPKPFAFPAAGNDVFAKACKDEGVAALFCCPGNYTIITSMANQGIPTFGGRTEGAMTAAADAFIRVTGEIAAASGTEGPGFTNMICAIAAAKACRTPLLVVASNRDVRGDDTEEGIQRGYQQPTTEGLKKYGKRVTDINRVYEYTAYAFRQMRTGVPGPVHLDFAAETFRQGLQTEADVQQFVDKTRYRTDSKPHPDPKDVQKVVEMIQKASRPIIVASTGVFYSHACDVLRQYAEKTNIPVTESGPMRGKISDDHPLCASLGHKHYGSADLVVLIGQYCMPTVGEFVFGPDAKFIRIDPGAEDIGRNVPIDLAMVSDEKAALEALYESTPAMKHDEWIAEIKSSREAWEAENEEHYQLGLKHSAATETIHPAVMARELHEFLYNNPAIPKESTPVVAGGFGIGRYMRRRMRAFRPGQICNGAYQYGSIGPDVGYAFGVGIASRLGAGYQKGYENLPVVATTGDAGFGYSGIEVETLAKYRVPAIIIVYNNNAWGTWGGGSRNPLVGHAHLFQENVRYDKMAEALGGHGEYVTKPEEMRPALQNAWDVAKNEGRPSVINCQAKKEFWSRAEFPPGLITQVEPGIEAYNH